MLNSTFAKVIKLISENIPSNIKLAVDGSTSLALQGIDVTPHDIDILTDREGAIRIQESLKKYNIGQVVMEGETLENFRDRGLLIVAALVKNQNSNMASSEISASDHLLLRGVRKSTIFQNVNYLENLGLVALIKKKIGIYYMMGVTNVII